MYFYTALLVSVTVLASDAFFAGDLGNFGNMFSSFNLKCFAKKPAKWDVCASKTDLMAHSYKCSAGPDPWKIRLTDPAGVEVCNYVLGNAYIVEVSVLESETSDPPSAFLIYAEDKQTGGYRPVGEFIFEEKVAATLGVDLLTQTVKDLQTDCVQPLDCDRKTDKRYLTHSRVNCPRRRSVMKFIWHATIDSALAKIEFRMAARNADGKYWTDLVSRVYEGVKDVKLQCIADTPADVLG